MVFLNANRAMDDNTVDWLRRAGRMSADGRLFSPSEACERVVAFEKLLASRGIPIRQGSKLEAACLLTMELAEHRREPTRRGRILELRDDLRAVVGLLQIVGLVLSSESHEDFDQLVPHIRLLNDGSPTQNTFAPKDDQASNKVFELLVALASMSIGRNLRLDDPNSSDGMNPDVLVTMADGKRWGFACKVVHGDAPMTLFERISDGIEQIERSPADTGIVVVNLKNRLPHDEMLPLLSREPKTGQMLIDAHPRGELVGHRLAEFVKARTMALEEHVGREAIVGAFARRKALPGVLVVAETTAGIVSPRGTSLAMVACLVHVTFEESAAPTRFTVAVDAIFEAMNSAFQLR